MKRLLKKLTPTFTVILSERSDRRISTKSPYTFSSNALSALTADDLKTLTDYNNSF